ncbi:SH3 domain-containing protein [Phototrophicus methaneseepsis]|uniref:SH3 domain-containing protein n=1 Tax=Phototrophicus methaneseepsis TaxID=2710758 RepID=A0A7S8EB21_9CHLR|nr:S8 family serine peptidase [Phototrophicus methaneseepsis]QPC83649.1 SH3 domain-containing protein [Phototrophicus methaneseepsis]
MQQRRLFKKHKLFLVMVTFIFLINFVPSTQAVYAPSNCSFPIDRDVQLYNAIGAEYDLQPEYLAVHHAIDMNGDPVTLWVVGQTPNGEYWIIEKTQRHSVKEEPELFLLPIGDEEIVDEQIVAFSRDHIVQADCQPPQWGVPIIPSIDLNELVNTGIGEQYGLPISAWHSAGYTGRGVRVGVIDAGFSVYQAISSSYVELLSPDPGEGSHGTDVLTVLTQIAPDAEYYLAVASQNADEFEQAVEQLMALNPPVDIIIYAANAYTLAPERYYEAVLSATDTGILWVNAAGNIGAGYYFDNYYFDSSRNDYYFDDRNRNASSENTLMVPVDVAHPVTVRVAWDGTPTREAPGSDGPVQVPVNDLMLRVQNLFGPFDNNYYTADMSQAPNDDRVMEGNWEIPPIEAMTIPSDVLLTELQSTIRIPIYRDNGKPGAPQMYGECQQDNNCRIDAYNDNEIYIGLTMGGQGRGKDTISGTAFELFIEGAIPAEYDITTSQSLEPVVPVPGDLAEVLTVGAYNPSTNRLAWYSGRSNYSQFALGWPREGDQAGTIIAQNRVVKPDISTLGTLIIQRPDESTYTFEGTSAATPLMGGVAALLYNHPDVTHSADAVRTVLTRQATACLEDGAVGVRLPRLLLPLPGDIGRLENHTCSTYDYDPAVTEPRSNTRVGGEYNPLRAILDGIDNADRVESFIDLNGAASGSSLIDDTIFTVSNYVLEVRRADMDTEEWLLLDAVGSPNLPTPGGPDDNPCRYIGTHPDFVHEADLNFSNKFDASNFYREQISPYDYGAGDYIVRLTTCQGNIPIPGKSMQQNFTLARIEPSAEIAPIEEWGGLVISDREDTQMAVAGTVSILGQAEGGVWAGYVLQVRQLDDNQQSVSDWYPLQANDESLVGIAEDGDSPPNLCGTEAMQTREVRAGGELVQLNTETWQFTTDGDFSGDGFYELALTHCQGDEVPPSLPDRAVFLVNNYSLPFAEIVQPTGDVSGGLVEISGYVGGERFTRWLVTIAPTDSTSVNWIARLVSPDSETFSDDTELDARLEALCAEEQANHMTFIERPADPKPADSLGQFTVNEDDYPSGSYQLSLYRCEDHTLDMETHDAKTISLSYPENPVLTIIPGQRLSGDAAELLGEVYVPDAENFAYYSVEIAPVGDEARPDAWKLVVPQVSDSVNLETYCSTAPTDATGCIPRTGPLAELNTWNYKNTDYEVRLSLYLYDEQGNVVLWKPSDDISQTITASFTINNDTVVEVTTPPQNTSLDSQQMVLGRIQAATLESYNLSLHLQPDDLELPNEAADTTWPTASMVADWTTVFTYQSTKLAKVVDASSDLIGEQQINTASLPSGIYYLLLEINLTDDQSEAHTFGPYTIDHSPQLTVTDPPPSNEKYPVMDNLVVLGAALGDASYRGYVISTDYEQERWGKTETWTVQYPPLDESLTMSNTDSVGDALCQAAHERLLSADGRGLDMNQVGVIDDAHTELATIPLTNIPAGDNVMRIDLCTLAEGATDEPATWQLEASTTQFRYLDVTNPAFTVDLTGEIVTATQVNFVGEITVPDFAQYIIEVAPVPPAEPSEGQSHPLTDTYPWELIVGPSNVDSTGRDASQIIDPTIYCDTPIEDGNFGFSRVNQRGPLGAYTITDVNRNHHVRVTVCRTDHVPYVKYFFDVIPATGGPAPSWQATAIASPYVAVRSGPSRRFELVGRLNYGETATQVTGRNETGYWVKVVLSDGTEGWVSTSVVSVIGRGSVLELPIIAVDIPTIPSDIFLVMEVAGVRDIYQSDMNGANPQRVTTLGTVQTLGISPSGSNLVFDAITADGTIQVFRIQVDGSNLIQLTSGPDNNIMPSWTRDGRQIIFSSNRLNNYDLYVMDPLGNSVRPLVAEPTVAEYNGEAAP